MTRLKHRVDMKNKFKVALIGCGVISDNHITSLLALECVEIVSLVDIDTKKAKAKKEKYGLDCRIYSDYIKMLDTEKPDAIHVLTPHHLHTEMTLEALSRDVNVLLEKPMCIKPEDIEKIICAEKSSKATVSICFQTRFNETVKLAKQLTDEDGGVVNAYATVVWNRDDAYYAQGEWRGKKDTEGGGVMINQAIHTLDLLCIFLGIPKNIQAKCSKLRHTDAVEVEDACNCIIGFENGSTALVFATTNYSGLDSTSLHLETKNHTIEIKEPNLYVDGNLVEMPKITEYVGKKCYGTGHAPLVRNFYTSLEENRTTPIPPVSAQHAVKIILGAYASDGKMIDL